MCIRQRIGGSNPPLTAIFEMRACTKVRALFFYILHRGGMRTPDRGSTTGAASWTDRARSKRAAPQGRAKRVNPPLTAIFEMRACTKVRALFFYILHRGGMRTPDRGSTTGAASWTDRARSKRAAPQGRAKRVNPPLTAIFEMRACTKVRALFFYILHRGGMRTPDRGSTTGNASWTDRARSKRAAPTKTPGAFLNNACVGPAGARPIDGPSNGERSESIPPSPPYSR